MQNNQPSNTEVEMSDVRLLEEEDDTLPFGQSNLSSVLANPDFGRRRSAPSYSSLLPYLCKSCGTPMNQRHLNLLQAPEQTAYLPARAAASFV